MAYKVFQNIIQEIKNVENSGSPSATIILVYVGIDTMAYLSMPAKRKRNGSEDFIDWVKKYMKTNENQSYQYIGEDMWAARCGKLHSYSSYSEIGKKLNCKLYAYHGGSDHIYKKSKSEKLVLISIPRLVNDFINGTRAFLKEALNNNELKSLIDKRITKVNQQFNI